MGLGWSRKKKTTVLLAIGIIVVIVILAVWSIWKPNLKVSFYPPPPQEVHRGDNFQISTWFVNEGIGTAYGIRIALAMPEGFVEYVTGTNGREVLWGSLSYNDGGGWAFNITASPNLSPGTYNFTVTFSADNAPTQKFYPEIKVV